MKKIRLKIMITPIYEKMKESHLRSWMEGDFDHWGQ